MASLHCHYIQTLLQHHSKVCEIFTEKAKNRFSNFIFSLIIRKSAMPCKCKALSTRPCPITQWHKKQHRLPIWCCKSIQHHLAIKHNKWNGIKPTDMIQVQFNEDNTVSWHRLQRIQSYILSMPNNRRYSINNNYSKVYFLTSVLRFMLLAIRIQTSYQAPTFFNTINRKTASIIDVTISVSAEYAVLTGLYCFLNINS